jgi:hypothetical protein
LWRLLHLLTAAFFVIAVLAPTALAQDATNEKTGGEDPFFVAPKDETTELSAHHMKQEPPPGLGSQLPQRRGD